MLSLTMAISSIAVLVSGATVFSASAIVHPGPPPTFLTIKVGKHLYLGNETISIWGNKTTNPIAGEPIEIIISNSNQTIVIDRTLKLTANDSYSYQFSAASLGKIPDTFSVRVNSEGFDAVDYFFYIPGPYELKVGNTTYPLSYTLTTSGRLTSVSLNESGASLTAQIVNACCEGVFTIDIPRALLDFKTSGNVDSAYTVLLGIDELNLHITDYKELSTSNSSERRIQVQIPYDQYDLGGGWTVRVIGNQVVPEYSGFSLAIFGVSIMVMVIVAKRTAIRQFSFSPLKEVNLQKLD